MPESTDASASEPLADRHRRLARGFGAVVNQVRDWDAPTPVADWRARDVVLHLVTWSQGFLAAGGVDLGRPVDADDPAGTWREHAAEIHGLLESESARDAFTHPRAGSGPHTWDLAESAGVPSGLDPAECEQLLAGMSLHEQLLRDSGQYGPAVQVAPELDGVTRLMGFIGRDPQWRER
jgi:hypothetical protein